jgi:hypothetical protein
MAEKTMGRRTLSFLRRLPCVACENSGAVEPSGSVRARIQRFEVLLVVLGAGLTDQGRWNEALETLAAAATISSRRAPWPACAAGPRPGLLLGQRSRSLAASPADHAPRWLPGP